jgi:hypothetical protein
LFGEATERPKVQPWKCHNLLTPGRLSSSARERLPQDTHGVVLLWRPWQRHSGALIEAPRLTIALINGDTYEPIDTRPSLPGTTPVAPFRAAGVDSKPFGSDASPAD